MIEVKRLNPETILTNVKVGDSMIGTKTPNKITFGVFQNGQILRKNGHPEIYARKQTAEQVAQWYRNGN